MTLAFNSLEANIEATASHALVRPECERMLALTAERLLRDKTTWLDLQKESTVPAAALMALAEREMSGNLHCYLGNGQRLTMRTTLVPKGRGPFPDTPAGFVAGAMDALTLDGLVHVAAMAGGWSEARFCYESELWNGFGYRARGIPSPYVYGGTTVQRPGKFIRDGVYSSSVMDPQLGTLAIVEELVKLDPSLAFFDSAVKIVPAVDAPSIVPVQADHPVTAGIDIEWVQAALNKLKITPEPIAVDDNLGRETRAAVRIYEKSRGLTIDMGIPGPQVLGALQKDMAAA